MEIMKVIGILVGMLMAMLGVIMIYDARKETKKFFSLFEQNEGAKWCKIAGFLLFILGFILVFFLKF